ncbi:MAG: transketolase, partial [Planctomycetota bacterium]
MLKLDLNQEKLSPENMEELGKMRKKAAQSIIEMTTLAGCGHPGGSLSTLDFLLIVYASIRHRPNEPNWAERDRVFISHGHISPGVYSVLGLNGYFPLDEGIIQFRKAGTPFGGHVEIFVPGVEWNTGNLGQGLSAAAGSALAGMLQGELFKVVCCMGDGEQQKGQVSEARRFAVKNRLSNLIGFVDWNGLQIGGKITEIMPQNLVEEWRASGWNVLVVEDGHNYQELYQAFRKAYKKETESPEMPTVILAKTVMGKGISWMENQHKWHGQAPSIELARKAFQELGVEDRLDELLEKRKALKLEIHPHKDYTKRDFP